MLGGRNYTARNNRHPARGVSQEPSTHTQTPSLHARGQRRVVWGHSPVNRPGGTSEGQPTAARTSDGGGATSFRANTAPSEKVMGRRERSPRDEENDDRPRLPQSRTTPDRRNREGFQLGVEMRHVAGDVSQIRAENAALLGVINLSQEEINVAQLRRMSKQGMTRWVRFSFGGIDIYYAMVMDAEHSQAQTFINIINALIAGAQFGNPSTVVLGIGCEVRARWAGSGANAVRWIPYPLQPPPPSAYYNNPHLLVGTSRANFRPLP